MKRSMVTAAALAVLFIAVGSPAFSAGDPYRSRQWGLDRIHADDAWRASKGSGVTIAVVDSGIDSTHPDLRTKISASYSCMGGSCGSGGDDDNGHGSHVAGIAAAATGNGVGVSGVAPSAKLMAVKVIAANGSGACSDVELGIRWAADHGADVINLSLGPEILKGNLLGVLCIDGLEQAAAYAWDTGAVVVVAAGNDSLFSFYSSPDLLVVGATGADDAPASYSNSGADVYAPGGVSGSCTPARCIFSTYKDGGYASIFGTSMATPHASGIAALLIAKGYTNSQVLARIKSTADLVNGVRRVNAARAVGAPSAPSPGKKSSTPKPGSPGTQASGGGSGGSGSGSGQPASSPSAVKPSVLPTQLTPPSGGSPTSGDGLASGPAPRRPTATANRWGLIAGAVVLVLMVAGGTMLLRRRARTR